MQAVTFGVIVSNRNFFPRHLVSGGRTEILELLKEMGYGYIVLSGEQTPLGAVETMDDAIKCAALFKKNQDLIDGIIIVLPNFGDEVAVSAAIHLSGLKVPVLVQACEDNPERLDLENRRDAFCGKLSVCNNLYQRGIKFTNTSKHTCAVKSDVFRKDINRFAKICKVVGGITTARIGAIGTRPDPFHTVRYSEKLLQAAGITVSVADLSEIIALANKMGNSQQVMAQVEKIKSYGYVCKEVGMEILLKQARLFLTIEKWLVDNRCDASAIQCWSSIQNNYGCAACLSMSMLSEAGKPCACETDVMGALSMYALSLSSGVPSAYLDWNNNYNDDEDICISQHCSNFPKSFFGTELEISYLDILGTQIDKEKCFGACKAQVAPGAMTFAKITTDDCNGRVKAYIGEGEFLGDRLKSFGGVALCRIKNLQGLTKHICNNGFEHHVAMNRSLSAEILEEAFGRYLGWDVYRHV